LTGGLPQGVLNGGGIRFVLVNMGTFGGKKENNPSLEVRGGFFACSKGTGKWGKFNFSQGRGGRRDVGRFNSIFGMFWGGSGCMAEQTNGRGLKD